MQEGTTPCETLSAKPAQYPVAILVDTSQAARTEFSEMRKAVQHLSRGCRAATSRSTRSAIAPSGSSDFTRDTTRLERAVDQLFALPEGESHVLDAIIEAGRGTAADASRRSR